MFLVVLLLFLLISIGFYVYIRVVFNKFKNSKLKSKLSGFEVARKIIDNYDLNNVYITETRTEVMSKYDSNRKVIRLTRNVFNEESYVSCSIASIESGHAILDKKKDTLFNIKQTIMPIVNILVIIGYIITVLGCLFGHANTIMVGLSIMDLVLLFHILTYQIEKKSKSIAIVELVNSKVVTDKELKKVDKLLTVATFRNIASIIIPVVELFQRIVEFGDSNK